MNTNCKDCPQIQRLDEKIDIQSRCIEIVKEKISHLDTELNLKSVQFSRIEQTLTNIENELKEMKQTKSWWKEKGISTLFQIITTLIVAFLAIKLGLK